MLAAACELAARLSDAPGSPWVAFNASSQLVEDPDLVENVLAACARSGIEPSRLCLEVTERALMHATGGTREALALLRAAGVAIAIDDFGTGYASLTYLREFPATSLKIDRAFVSGVSTDRSDAAIVQAVVSLAHGLGMTVTAEGVEHVAQIELLRSLHCDHLQGFEFGAAMTADELLALVRGQRQCAPPDGLPSGYARRSAALRQPDARRTPSRCASSWASSGCAMTGGKSRCRSPGRIGISRKTRSAASRRSTTTASCLPSRTPSCATWRSVRAATISTRWLPPSALGSTSSWIASRSRCAGRSSRSSASLSASCRASDSRQARPTWRARAQRRPRSPGRCSSSTGSWPQRHRARHVHDRRLRGRSRAVPYAQHRHGPRAVPRLLRLREAVTARDGFAAAGPVL